MKTVKEYREWYRSPEFEKNYTCEQKDFGALCSEKGSVFKLWSPAAEKVTLQLYKKGSKGDAFLKIPMEREEKGVWVYRTGENLHGVYYDYVLSFEGKEVTSADPWARACGVNGKRSMAVDLSRTNPEGWQEDKAPAYQEENVIYEIHVGEFSWHKSGGFPEEYRGTYKALTCAHTTLNNDGIHPTGLDYLKELGVTHIQLMPVFDYGSVDEAGDREQFNWGYDPVNYNVPEGSYATDAENGEVRIWELKEMIQSLHRNGFRVIMDVVYNHTYSMDSCFQRTMPWYYYRTKENGTPENGSACGNDVASERTMCGKYILESVLYWAEEYHMDGFRFDLMGLLDVELLNAIRKALDEKFGKGEKLMYGEPWAAAPSPMEGGAKPALKENIGLLDENVGMFCDNLRDAVKGHVFEGELPGFVNGGKGLEKDIVNGVRAWCKPEKGDMGIKAPSQVISYVSAHDNWTLWDKLSLTIESGKDSRKAIRDRLAANRLAAGIYMTCQGNLFFLSGEEFARTKDGVENSYNSSRTINRMDWERAYENTELRRYYQGLIALRKKLPGLCDKTPGAEKRILMERTGKNMASVLVDNTGEKASEWEQIYLIYYAGKKRTEAELPEGEWEILADGENSFLWKNPETAAGKLTVSKTSVRILGKRKKTEG